MDWFLLLNPDLEWYEELQGNIFDSNERWQDDMELKYEKLPYVEKVLVFVSLSLMLVLNGLKR